MLRNEISLLSESSAATMSNLIPPEVRRIEYASPVDDLRDWALVRPPDRGDTWAVMIHGHGSHGDQPYTRADVRRHRIEPILATGVGVLSPNLRDNAWMSPAAASDLQALLIWARSRHDARRFIFISGSMGGTSNLIYATLHPEDVAAVAALGAVADLPTYRTWCLQQPGAIQQEIAGAITRAYGGTPESVPDPYRLHSPIFHAERLTMPVFLAHGEKDTLMPVAQMRMLARKLSAHKNSTYIEIPGGNHDSPLFCEECAAWLKKTCQAIV